jgi:hypothetical protein
MSFNPSSPVTGAAQTGFTTPTYTLVADQNPAPNGKQWAVTAIGGTQANVDVHSVSKPFTLSVFKPSQLKTLPAANPVTGVIKSIPKNTYKVITRKGALPSGNQSPQTVLITTIMEIPAGCDTYEPEEIRAALALHIGAISAQSAGLGDTSVSGLL